MHLALYLLSITNKVSCATNAEAMANGALFTMLTLAYFGSASILVKLDLRSL